jgi:hypothetical protein
MWRFRRLKVIDCLIIVAAVCLHDVKALSIDERMGARAEVELSDAHVSIQLRTDQIQTLEWRKMPGACADGFCVAYFKHCIAEQHVARCSYHFAGVASDGEQVVDVSAPTLDRIRQAEKSISVLSPLGLQGGAIALSQFREESSADAPPYCRAGGPLADCWPKPLKP